MKNSDDKWKDKIRTKYGDDVFFVRVVEYLNAEAQIEIKCSRCGGSNVISAITLRKQERVGYQCPGCLAKRREREILQKEEIKRVQTLRRAKHVQVQMRFCSCGSFIGFNGKVCDQCKRQKAKETQRRLDRKKETKRRMRCKGGDWNISLKDLYERDQGICYLCGCRCDWRDGEWKDGAFIVGPTYPSIEHVIPLSKGGTHEWNNVKLACWICNTRKGAR